MKLKILNKQGTESKEIETTLFEEPIREDLILKVVEAEKIWQPYSNKYRAGMDISASGNASHRRHKWKSDRGRGLSRIPRKVFWRRGTQFSWEGAVVPSTKGGRRAHPPKSYTNLKKINKKELKKALLSALTLTTNLEKLNEKYTSVNSKELKTPIVIEESTLNSNLKELNEFLKKILNDFYKISFQKKSIRTGKGKLRGRKYKQSAGLLIVIGKNENKKSKGIEIIKADELLVKDLASNGARLTIFTENAIKDLENFKNNTSSEKNTLPKNEKSDKRKLKKQKRKSTKKPKLKQEEQEASKNETINN